jgi:hypothetical protein
MHGPFVVLLEEDCADEPGHRGFVGKIPTTSVRRLISPLRRSSGFSPANGAGFYYMAYIILNTC